MSLEKKLDYKNYDFKFNEDDVLMVKNTDEINRINKLLKEESPESDYDSYSWYLSEEKLQDVKYKKLKIEAEISWHGGLPFYKLYKLGALDGYKLGKTDNVLYSIAEFYLQEYKKFKPDSEGLTLHDIFKNIPEKEGVRIGSRVPIRLKGFEVAYEESYTGGSGMFSLIFLQQDVENMSDQEVEELARTFQPADMHKTISISRKKDVVYASFGYHHVTVVPGTKPW